MATVIVASDIDPTLQIRVVRGRGDNLWGGTCPKCRQRIATTIPSETLGRDIATEMIMRHLDQGCQQ